MSDKVISNFEKDIYQKYYPLVFSNCKKRLYDSNAIEDAVQSTFLMYIREQESISSSLSSWLYWTSSSVCKVINKETKQNKSLPDQRSLPLSKTAEKQPLLEEETQIQLKTILDSLPKKKQEILLMRFFDEMSYLQIAQHFKSSEDGIRKMIEHTLETLKSKLNKKDIAFSVLFSEFFKTQSRAENIGAAVTKSQAFILQNTVKQQLIVKGVHKMILFSKLKLALILCVSITLPLSAVLVAESNKKFEIVKEQETPKKQISKIKEMAASENEEKLIGTWVLKNKTKEWPHPIGSTLTIKNDGTFEILSEKNGKNSNAPGPIQIKNVMSGKYTIKDSTFTFDFDLGPNQSKRSKYQSTYTLGTENNLSFKVVNDAYIMTMEYIKEEKK